MQFFLKSLLVMSLALMQQPPLSKLANTSWSGVINIPDAAPCTFTFKNDTLYAYVNNQLFETNTYKENGDTLFLTKVIGESPCQQELGQYKYDIQNGILKLTLLQDSCGPRSRCFSAEGYKKQLK